MKKRTGKVTFVGAGPGDPGLMTVRGRRALEEAKVVLYDAELGEELLSLCRTDAELLPTGLPGGLGPQTPDEIKDVLVERGRRGLSVVRLRQGDAITASFSAGEMMHLRALGIEFDVVPGLPVTVAASAAAGVPILQPGIAGKVLIIEGLVSCERPRSLRMEPVVKPEQKYEEPRRPGVVIRRSRKSRKESSATFQIRGAESETTLDHGKKKSETSMGRIDTWRSSETSVPLGGAIERFPLTGEEPADVVVMNWKATCTAADTLVFTRPLPCLNAIRDGLLQGGRSPHEPVVAISQGATPHQRTVVSTVDKLAREIGRENLKSPCTLIVGDAVNLQEHLNLFENRPLFSLKLAVTRAESRNAETSQFYRELGAQVLPFPLEQTRPVAGLPQVLDAMSDDLRLATHIVFTTETSVEIFLKALREAELDLRLIPEQCSVIAVGQMTRSQLRDHGIRAQVVREPFTNDNLMESFEARMNGDRVLILGSTDARPELSKELHIRGANVTHVPLYEKQPSKLNLLELRQALTKGEVDCVAFFSASSVEVARAAWGDTTFKRLLTDVGIASISAATSVALADCGLTAQVEAQRPTLESLSRMLMRWRLDPSTFRDEVDARHDLDNW